MDLEEQVRAAIAAELGRQAADAGDGLSVSVADGDCVAINGTVDLAAVAMAVVGAVAGGP